MTEKVLKTGVAYHGNRILRHVEEDMKDIAGHNMNIVVHMFTHNDWDRHLGVMKNIFDMSRENGLEVWVDNWGIGGSPGDKSHFLEYYPDSHQVFNDGEVSPTQACLNSPHFLEFTKQWIDAVKDCGGDKIFWDEPHFFTINTKSNDHYTAHGDKFTCCCKRCKKLFEEKYGKEMPNELTEEVEEFRMKSITKYFDEVTTYAASKGMENISCIMPHTLKQTSGIAQLPNISNFGIDPYWRCTGNIKDGKIIKSPYDFLYDSTKEAAALVEPTGKDYNIWLQAFGIPENAEEEFFMAADGAYDAGARNILTWSYRGAESNTYKSARCEYLWHIIGEAMRRLKDRNLDAIRNEYYSKK